MARDVGGLRRRYNPIGTRGTALGRIVIAVTILLSAVTGASTAISSAEAQNSGWSILQYDKDGNPTGVIEGNGNFDDANGAPGSNGGKTGDDASGTVGTDTQPTAPSPLPPGKKIEKNEILVADPPIGMRTALQREGFVVLERDEYLDKGLVILRLRVPQGMTVVDALRFVRARYPNVTSDTNDILDLQGHSLPPTRTQLAQTVNSDYSRKLVGWQEMLHSCGAGLNIGQIDGAVEVDHRALVGQNLIYRSFHEKNRQPAAGDHGTAVAITLIGKSLNGGPSGLLPGATLYAANIFEMRDGRRVGNLTGMLRAIDWLTSHDVKVANLSIAGTENKIMRIALNRAASRGLLMIAAAGNNGPDAPEAWPAAHPSVIAVTAIDRRLRIYTFANQGNYIDFAAPGVNLITQTPHGLKTQSGTSFAAPFVTAIAAMHIKAGYPAEPKVLVNAMKKLAHDIGEPGKDSVYGFGLLRLNPSCQ